MPTIFSFSRRYHTFKSHRQEFLCLFFSNIRFEFIAQFSMFYLIAHENTEREIDVPLKSSSFFLHFMPLEDGNITQY